MAYFSTSASFGAFTSDVTDNGTYYDNFLSSIELLPNDIRRDFELMKELDRESIELNKELMSLEIKYITNLKKKVVAAVNQEKNNIEDDQESKDLMEEIVVLRQRVKQRLHEKSGIATNLTHDIDKIMKKLDADLTVFQVELANTGNDIELLNKYTEPGTDVAIRPSLSSNDLILGRVIQYHPDTGRYDVSDFDDSNKRYSLSESQVFVLDSLENQRKIGKGEEVYAVYPDTTAFYPATVVQGSRKNINGGEQTITVQFVGDADASGNTPCRAINARYVIRPFM